MNLCSPCMKLIKSPLLLTNIRVCIEVLVNIHALQIFRNETLLYIIDLNGKKQNKTSQQLLHRHPNVQYC